MAHRVLMVEDNPGDARLLRELIAESPEYPCEVTVVDRLADGIAHAKDGRADVVLLDLSLPDSHGLDTFRRLQWAAPSIPVVVLTGLDDRTVAVQAVREGAQDFLVKGQVDGGLLLRAIGYAIERQRLITRLRELDRLKSLFLSVVSHDLKSPVAAIQFGIDMLLTGRPGDLNEKQRHVLDLARRNAQRQVRLINDLLDVTRIEAGAMVLTRKPLPLEALVQSTVEELSALAAERQIRLEIRYAQASCVAEVDPDRVVQAIANIASNAVKFARSTVCVAVDASEEEVRVLVDDDGPGIPAPLAGQLFERFVRGEGKEAGSGLGLSIVRGIVEAHGGWVRAENREEGGARFTIAFPRARTSVPP